MDWLEAALLGAIQGITEFLPVSSSGHITTLSHFFGVEDAGLTLSIVLHLGTLIATVLLLRTDVWALIVAGGRALSAPRQALETRDGRVLVGVVLASIPTAIIGLLLKDWVESAGLWLVAICFLVSAALVVSTRFSEVRATKDEISMVSMIVVGVAQGIAVLPGISRSGTTIAIAMMLGLSGAAAFRFSFLLSLPAVTGAVLLLLLKDGAFSGIAAHVWFGGFVACVVGIASLLLLRKLVDQGRFWAFAFYLVPLGLGLLGYEFFL